MNPFVNRIRRALSMIMVVLLVVGSQELAPWMPKAEAAATWDEGDMSPFNVDHISFGNGVWLATGMDRYYISTDGSTWDEKLYSGADNCSARATVYSGGKWYVACYNGAILSSDNLDSWMERTVVPEGLYNITSNGTTLVAVGGNENTGDGVLLTSTDGGVTWRNSLPNNDIWYLIDIIYANGQFMTVGADKNYSPVILVSSDGMNWNPLHPQGPVQPLNGIAYGDGHYVAVGFGGEIYTSADGVSWNNSLTPPNEVSGNDFFSVAYSNGKFYAVGTEESIISFSFEQGQWNKELETHVNYSVQLTSIEAANGRVVAVGEDGIFKTANLIPPLSSESRLSGLQISPVGIPFNPDQETYMMPVPHGTTEVSVTPTTMDSAATLTVNGASRFSGAETKIQLDADGSTDINIIVTAQNGITTTYDVNVVEQAPSNNAFLRNIQPTMGSLSPAFSQNQFDYEVAVPYPVVEIGITPELADSHASYTLHLDGKAITDAEAQHISLLPGVTGVLEIEVTAQNGVDQQSYQVNVKRASPAKDATLSSLSLNGAIVQGFQSNKLVYSESVPYTTEMIDVSWIMHDPNAAYKVLVGGQEQVGSTEISDLSLTPGTPTEITIEVTAEDPAVKETYKLTVTRAEPAKNAALNSLTIDGALVNGFQSDGLTYAEHLPFTNDSVDVDWVASDPNATYKVRVDGQEIANAPKPYTLPLLPGADKVIEIVVTAQDTRIERTYTLTVTRGGPATDATLSGLTINGIAVKDFQSGKTDYTEDIPYTMDAVHVDWTVNDVHATYKIKVDGQEQANVTRLANLPLTPGTPKVIEIEVTAQDTNVKMTYQLQITRANPATDATLSSINIDGNLLDGFQRDQYSYTKTVPYTTTAVDVDFALGDPSTATFEIKLDGVDVGQNQLNGIALIPGTDRMVEIKGIAQDQSEKIYRLTLKRELPATDATLDSLSIDGHLVENFRSDRFAYTVVVPYTQELIDVSWVLRDPNRATFRVMVDGQEASGNELFDVILTSGVTKKIEIEVKAQDPNVIQTYTLNVTRDLPSNNALLGSLAVSSGASLEPSSFVPTIAEYKVQALEDTDSFAITPVLADTTASIRITEGTKNTSWNSGEAYAIALDKGETKEVEIVVLAQDSITSQTYTLQVSRAPSTNALLRDIHMTAGTLNPGFDPAVQEYALLVPYMENEVGITPVLADSKASFQANVDGQAVNETELSNLVLIPGVTRVIEIQVTAQKQAVTALYKLTVTRAEPATDAALSSLNVDGALVAGFQSDALEYTVHMPTAKSAINVNWTLRDAVNATSTVKIDGKPVNDSTLEDVALVPGVAKVIEIEVKAQDGSTQVYRLTVIRAKGVVNPPSEPSSPAPGPTPLLPVPVNEKAEIDVDGGFKTPVAAKMIIDRTKESGKITEKLTLNLEKIKAAIHALPSAKNTIRLVIPDKKDEVTRLDVNIPAAVLKELSEAKKRLEIYTDHARIQLSLETMKGLLDSYFRIVPVRDVQKHAEVLNGALQEEFIQQFSLISKPSVVARPMVIETNLSNREVTVVLPLKDVTLPQSLEEHEAYAKSLAVFIEHSDGERELIAGSLVDYDNNGLMGIQFTVKKFSTFAILSWPGQDMNKLLNEASVGNHEAYIQGFADGTFRPEQGVTREQLAAMLARLLGGETAKISGFTDVGATHWAAEAIAFVQEQGLMIGDPSGQFAPDQEVTRAELAVIAARYKELNVVNQDKREFTDVALEHWAMGAITASKQAGLLQGYTDGSFRPDRSVTRAEAVTILNKMFGRYPIVGLQLSSWKDVPTAHWAFGDIEEASRSHQFKVTDEGMEQIMD
ncbi:Endoglucanase precursor [Actinobacillus pleuropneumoniae]|nr:Endoglucanase precursor [Actinobacillus pleuropneumoniae]